MPVIFSKAVLISPFSKTSSSSLRASSISFVLSVHQSRRGVFFIKLHALPSSPLLSSAFLVSSLTLLILDFNASIKPSLLFSERTTGCFSSRKPSLSVIIFPARIESFWSSVRLIPLSCSLYIDKISASESFASG